jgi:xanthine dehydrogenase accessory factor
MNLWDEINTARKEGRKATVCTVVKTTGSTPRKVGAKMLVFEDGAISGSIGGGMLEKKCIDQALKQLVLGEPITCEYNLVKDLKMCCGGRVAIYFEPMLKNNILYIFGAGHTGQALAELAINQDFDICVFDDRPEYLEQVKMEGVETKLIDFSQDLSAIATNPNTYIVIMTYDHPTDRAILSVFAQKESAYLGMIGSQRKIIVTKKMLKNEQLASLGEIKKIDMPIGIPINAETPSEIAISVMAKLIEVKNG